MMASEKLPRLGDQFIGIIVAKSFGGQRFITFLKTTLPETKPASSHLKMDGWNTFSFSFWDVFFFFPGRAVSFREGNSKFAPENRPKSRKRVVTTTIFHGLKYLKCQFKGL